MRRYLTLSLALLVAACTEPDSPPADTIVEATVTRMLIVNVVDVDGSTKSTSASVDATTLGYRDPSDPCRGLYSLHVLPEASVSYTDAPGVAVPVTAIVEGSKVRFDTKAAQPTICGSSVELATIAIVRP